LWYIPRPLADDTINERPVGPGQTPDHPPGLGQQDSAGRPATGRSPDDGRGHARTPRMGTPGISGPGRGLGPRRMTAVPRPRLIKTHLGFDLTPYAAAASYLVVLRNPFDCAVSFYHHTQGFPRHYDFAQGSFAAFFDCFIRGEVDFGGYFEHLLSWHAASSRANVRLMTYESMRREPRPALRDIASFLGGRAAAAVATDAGQDAILCETSLAAMQRDQQRWSSERPAWATRFVRKGAVGDWRSLFTAGQARALLAEFESRLAGTPLIALWPEVLEEARAFAGGHSIPVQSP